MIDKPLIIIIFLYLTSFMLLGMQFVLGDIFGVTMTNFEGEEMRSAIIDLMRYGNLNELTNTFAEQDETPSVLDSIWAYVNLGWELVQLLTGTYVFNLLRFFGIPHIFVAGIVGVYLIMIGRTVLGYIRGV